MQAAQASPYPAHWQWPLQGQVLLDDAPVHLRTKLHWAPMHAERDLHESK